MTVKTKSGLDSTAFGPRVWLKTETLGYTIVPPSTTPPQLLGNKQSNCENNYHSGRQGSQPWYRYAGSLCLTTSLPSQHPSPLHACPSQIPVILRAQPLVTGAILSEEQLGFPKSEMLSHSRTSYASTAPSKSHLCLLGGSHGDSKCDMHHQEINLGNMTYCVIFLELQESC